MVRPMSLSIRCMTTDDIDLGMRLKAQAGWNQVPADWERFLDLEPDGCFVGEWEGRSVATTTTCTFGSVGWIGMVLVDESFRHRGIATRLVERALEYLDGRSVTTVRLDATRFGRPVYEQIGFVAEHEFVRFQGVARAVSAKLLVESACGDPFEALITLDRLATGTNRARLLERLMIENPATARVIGGPSTLEGYAMLRSGANATQIGPAVAQSPEAGQTLGDWALSQCAGSPVFVDVPDRNRAAREWAQHRGLIEQRRFTRMVRGEPVEEDVALLWASSGPEKG